MNHSQSTRDLFNTKASTWDQKYDENSPLVQRISRFTLFLTKNYPPPAKVLDFGCGTGNLAIHLQSQGYEVSGCDIADKMLDEARKADAENAIEWTLLETDWARLPFDDSSFDVIVASSVFEYLPDINKVLKECKRILKPGGVLVTTVPNPYSSIRRVEGILKYFAVALKQTHTSGLVPKIDRYCDYLKLSHNRFSIGGWKRRGQDAHFKACRVVNDKSAKKRPSLMLLTFNA